MSLHKNISNNSECFKCFFCAPQFLFNKYRLMTACRVPDIKKTGGSHAACSLSAVLIGYIIERKLYTLTHGHTQN